MSESNPDTDPRQRFRRWGASGLLGHAVPATYHGNDDDFRHLAAAHEDFGRAMLDTGLVLALNAHIWGSLFPILTHGSDEQRRTWLPGLVRGELIAGHAITEPQAGSDLQGLETRAVVVEGGYRLHGHKRWITNTPDADMLVVYARLEDGLSTFLVRRDDPGTAFLDGPTVDACHSAGMGDLRLEDCRIPGERLLGAPGNGQLMVQQALELERAFIFAGICGILEAQLQSVIRFSRRRRIGNRPLARNQAIAHRIADMRTRLDTLRLWVRHCAELRDAGKPITLASSQTKLLGAEGFLQSSLDAVQIMGTAGLETGRVLQRQVCDAMASRLFSGSSEVQRNIIAAMLGVGE